MNTTITPTAIGNRRELFVDDALIDAITGKASLRMHTPTMKGIVWSATQPWEGNMCGGYKTYFHDGEKFRMYYQSWRVDIAETDGKMSLKEGPIYIACLESDDGINWRRPALRLIDFDGSTDNNITFAGIGPMKKGVHGFAPFKDTNPAATDAARYKAAGASVDWPCQLYALQSPDGFRWSLMRDEPIITEGAFDSQNLAFWDVVRSEYRAYIRDFSETGTRGIKTCTSPDFINWTKPQWLEYVDSPVEQLYTNQVQPYYRAPHIFIGFPTRYVERKWSPSVEALPEVEHRRMRSAAGERYGAAVTDGLFMAGRDGRTFKRWDEAFIRPGLRTEGSWAYGDCYQGWGLLETASDVVGSPNELTMFASEGYWRRPLNSFRRYTLRIDGFVSLHAPLGGGELITKPLTFTGDRLHLNISTSAAGSARVEIQTPAGHAIEGFTLNDCTEVIGDSLAFPVRWGDRKLATLENTPIRLRFVLKDADLYSYRFADIG